MRKISLLVFFYCLTTICVAQYDSLKSNCIVTLNLLSLINKELNLSYEGFINPFTGIEGSIGYRFGNTNESIYYTNNFINGDIDYSARYKSSVYGALALKRGIPSTKSNRYYLSAVAFYRHNFHNAKLISIGSMTYYDEEAYRLSMKQHVFGLKLLTGYRQKLFSIGEAAEALIDFYAGLGIRFKNTVKTYYEIGDYVNYSFVFVPYDPPKVITTKEFWPSIHAGLKLGFAF